MGRTPEEEAFTNFCFDLGLSVRTLTLLERAGVSSPEALRSLDLWRLHEAGAGKLALTELQAAKARMRGAPEELVTPEQIASIVAAPEVTDEVISSIGGRLVESGWTPLGERTWQWFNREERAVARVELQPGRRALWLQVSQEDEGVKTIWAPRSDLAATAALLNEHRHALTYLGVAKVARALAPHLQHLWMNTRGGYFESLPWPHPG